jgi:Holliday junction resolvasome RuvABC endonuclease subunit
MLTLGLDPSLSSYGWCVYDDSKTGIDKVVARGRWKTSSKALEVTRYMYLRDMIRSTIQHYGIIRVGVETPPVGSSAWSQEKLYGLFVYNMEAFWLEQVDVVLIAPSQLHLFAKIWGSGVVKGDWFKSDMQRMAQIDMLDLYKYPKHGDYAASSDNKRKKLRSNGYAAHILPYVDTAEYDKDTRKALRIQADEADAYHAARLANRFFRLVDGDIKESDLTPSEWDIFARTHTYTRGVKAGETDYHGILYKEDARFYRFATGSDSSSSNPK